MCLLNSVTFRYHWFSKKHVWFLYRYLKIVSQRPLYFLRFQDDDLRLVYNAFHITISFRGARILVTAITEFIRFRRLYFVANFSFVVVGGDGLDVNIFLFVYSILEAFMGFLWLVMQL